METRENRLRIDSVLTTQSELGPSIPDGGYGWIILLTSIFFQLLVPSMTVAFGIFMVFLRLESDAPRYPFFWDNPLIYTPLFFMASWTFVDPWTRKLIENSKWPRLVGTSGVCLTCSGLLFIWFAISKGSLAAGWFVTAGLFSGVGASILIAQSEVLIAQYFKLKLKHVNTCLQTASVIGFIFTPLILGDYIISDGLLTVIIWYQIVLLQGLIVCTFIKKPPYLKRTGNPYKLIKEGNTEDEIDIFSKNSRELQNARHSTPNTPQTEHPPSTSTGTGSNRNISQQDKSDLVDIQVHSDEFRPSWVKFEDEPDASQDAKAKLSPQKSHSTNRDDLDKIETLEEMPQPLFTETHLNNNNSYAFDGVDASTDEPVVFMPNVQPKVSFVQSKLYFLKQPTFYKSLLQVISLKFSIFMFYAMFPSFVYMRIEKLKFYHTTQIVGYVSSAALVFVGVMMFVSPTHRIRAFFLWLASWMGALGYVLLTDVKSEVWFVLGSILIIINIQSIQYFGQPLLNITRRGETNYVHVALCTFTGLAFLIFFIMDLSYVNCFRMLALLHFVMGGIWFANFLFKKMKPMFVNLRK